MKLLLDTCTFLWLIAAEHKLSPVARELLEAGENTLFLHQASIWEIQLKHQKGQLSLSESPQTLIPEALRLHQIDCAHLSNEAIWHLEKLPEHHKDPFDRMLVAQSSSRGFALMSEDSKLSLYNCQVI